jgi:hypothetical protein
MCQFVLVILRCVQVFPISTMAKINRKGTSLVIDVGSLMATVIPVVEPSMADAVSGEIWLSAQGFSLPDVGKNLIVSPVVTMSWSSLHPKTTVFTFGPCRRNLSAIRVSNRSLPCVDTQAESTASGTTRAAIPWPLPVLSESLNYGPLPLEII